MGLEPLISSVRSDRSTNCATTTAQNKMSLSLQKCLNSPSLIVTQPKSLYYKNLGNGRCLIWDWFEANWYGINLRFEPDLVMNIISDVTEDFNTGHDLDKLEMFYVDHADEFGMAADEAMLTAIKETKANLHWMKNHHPELVLMIQKKNMAAPQQ